MKHPVLKRNTLAFYIAGWLIISIIHALILRYSQDVAWRWAIADSLVFNFLYAAFALSFWYMCRYTSIENLKIFKLVENHAFASVFSSLIWLGLSYFLLVNVFSVDEIFRSFLYASLIWRMLIGVLFYFLCIAFYYVYIYSVNLKKQLVKESELKTLIKEAELKTLKFQINPHFIFNSLNSIHSLTLTDPKKAGEMTVKLGEYLRFTLSKNEKQKSILREELASIKLYLDIEKVRFGDKILFIEDIQEQCLEETVPTMLLQPLFENAIKYGVYESLDETEIKFTCSLNGDYLKMSLANEFDPEAVTRKGEGIGLRNISDRLEKMYSKNNLLEIEKKDNVFTVTVFMPIKER